MLLWVQEITSAPVLGSGGYFLGRALVACALVGMCGYACSALAPSWMGEHGCLLVLKTVAGAAVLLIAHSKNSGARGDAPLQSYKHILG